MHANGARVAIAGREASKLELARQTIGENVLAFQVDVLSRKGLATMASKVKEAFGGLDVFFANAGVAYVTPLGTTTEDAYNTLMDLVLFQWSFFKFEGDSEGLEFAGS